MTQLQKQILDIVRKGIRQEWTWPEIIDQVRPYRERGDWDWGMELWMEGVRDGLETR